MTSPRSLTPVVTEVEFGHLNSGENPYEICRTGRLIRIKKSIFHLFKIICQIKEQYRIT